MLGILGLIFTVIGVVFLWLCVVLAAIIFVGTLLGLDKNDKDYFYDLDGE
jgi:hypothetical protein